MKIKIIFTILIFVFSSNAQANNIYVDNFDELINSANISQSGDTITLTNNLISEESIGNNFYSKDLTFQGESFSLDGQNNFGGFVLSDGSNFNNFKIANCKGQNYGGYYYAGAIYNSIGNTSINNSAFTGNYINAQGFNIATGGALYNIDNGFVKINSSLFNNNYAHGASATGGALGNDGSGSVMDISNSVISDNFTFGTAVSYGGALYNTSGATANITNSLFYNNYSTTDDRGVYLYGGSIYNTGNLNINESYFENNHIIGGTGSVSYGGAIHNNGNLYIDNTTFENNYITSDIDASGGAIYNYIDGSTTIENSTFENNYLDSQNTRGGAIGNEGILTIINSTFKNNYDSSGLNDIYNINTINFNGDGITNIYSGIRGSGEIYKNDSGVLNLGGNNSNFRGCLYFNEGTINILADSSYFNAKLTDFYNGVNFNMQNNQIDNIDFGTMALYGTSNIYPDVDFNLNKMDTINAMSITGGGNILIPNLKLTGTPTESYIAMPFADETLKNYVNYNESTLQTPIYNYLVSYNKSNGYFDFSRNSFNSGILAPAVASQLGSYLTQIDIFNNIFSNLDMVMTGNTNKKIALANYNKTANLNQGPFTSSTTVIPEQNVGIWLKPFATFENVPLKNSPDVSNVAYGNIFGGESKLLDLKKGWKYLYGGYGGYLGSHQAYDGVSIYNNGGFIGATAALYRKNFFSLWTANVGANCAKSNSLSGNSDFTMLNTGIAQKTGINIALGENKFIIQPSIMTSYTFVNTFDFTYTDNIDINSKPLNALHIEPQIKFIGNFKNMLQPYIAVSFAWNLIDQTKFSANDIYLPELSVKPYVRYGAGIQKRWGDYLVGFIQAYITNGGRNGIGLQAGLRWSIGKAPQNNNHISKNNIPIPKKTEFVIKNISTVL